MQERKERFYSTNKREKKFYNKKIKCRCCNWFYRTREIQNGYVWSCAKKGISFEKCPSRSYTDNVLNNAFMKLYNILKHHKKELLDETISQLQALKTKVNSGNNAILEIDEEIATLGKQNNLYGQMFANGVLDEVTYYEKSGMIKGRITDLRSRRQLIIKGDDDESCLEELRELRRIIDESPDYLTEMDKDLFSKTVKLIYAEEDGSLSFILKGDIEFRVNIAEENNGE